MVCKTWEPYKPLGQILVTLVVPAVLTPLLATHLSRIGACALTALVYHATLCTSIVLYRISPFHPYYRYPGPVLCKLSRVGSSTCDLRIVVLIEPREPRPADLRNLSNIAASTAWRLCI